MALRLHRAHERAVWRATKLSVGASANRPTVSVAGTTLTATPKRGGTLLWYRNGVSTGQTTTTITASMPADQYATFTVRETAGTTLESLAVVVEPVTTSLLNADFSVYANGTYLAASRDEAATLPLTPNVGLGFYGYASGGSNASISDVQVQGGKLRLVSAADTGGYIFKNISEQFYEITVTGPFSNDRRYVILAGDATTNFGFCLLSGIRVGAIDFVRIYDGETGGSLPATLTDTSVVKYRVDRANNRVRVFLDNVELPTSGAGDAGYVNGTGFIINRSGGTALGATSRIGVACHYGVYPTVGTDLFNTMTANTAVSTGGFNITATATMLNTGLAMTVAGAAAGVTNAEVLITETNGTVVMNWTAAGAITSGTLASKTFEGLPTSYLPGTLKVHIRDVASPTTGQTVSVAIPALQTVPAMTFGINGYYDRPWSPQRPYTNEALQGEWRTQAFGYYLTGELNHATGCISAFRGGDTQADFSVFENCSVQAGVYDVNIGPNASLVGLVNCSITQALNGAGIGQITVASTTALTALAIRYTAVPTQFPIVRKVANAAAGEASPDYLADLAYIKVTSHRFMTQFGMGGLFPELLTPITSATPIAGNASAGGVFSALPHRAAKITQAAGIDGYFSVHRNADASYLTYAGNAWAVNTNPGKKLLIEDDDEIWNAGTTVYYYRTWDGCQKGLWNVVDQTPVSAHDCFAKNTYFSGLTPARTFAANEYVVINIPNTGICMFKALQAIPASAVGNLPSTATSNAYWQLIADNTATSLARKQAQGQRTLDIRNAFRAAYAAAGRDPNDVKTVVGLWSVDSAAETLKIVTRNRLCDVVDYYAVGYYLGTGTYGTKRLSDYTVDYPGWTQADKDLYLTDTAACATKFFAALNAEVIPLALAGAAHKQELYQALRGISALGAGVYMAYEAGPDLNVSNWPNQTKALDLVEYMRQDARFGALLVSMQDAWKKYIGGPYYHFDMTASFRVNATYSLFAYQGYRGQPASSINGWSV